MPRRSSPPGRTLLVMLVLALALALILTSQSHSADQNDELKVVPKKVRKAYVPPMKSLDDHKNRYNEVLIQQRGNEDLEIRRNDATDNNSEEVERRKTKETAKPLQHVLSTNNDNIHKPRRQHRTPAVGPQPMADGLRRKDAQQRNRVRENARGPRPQVQMGGQVQLQQSGEPDYIGPLDKAAIQTVASPVKVTIITIIDKQYLQLLENFDLFMKRIKLPQYLVVSLDKKSYTRLLELGVNTVYDPSVEAATLKRTGFLSPAFKKKSAMKFKVLSLALKRGYAALLLDIDVILVKDPFSYLTCLDCDIEVQDNIPPHLWYTPSSKEDLYCIGFVFVRQTSNNIRLVDNVYSSLLAHPEKWDQVEFNRQAKKAVSENRLRIKRLDFDQFPFGDPYFLEHYLEPNPLSTVVAYHINWVKDYVEKIYRAKEMALWLVDERGYYSNKTAKYLQYDNPLPELRSHEWGSLVLAFRLAKLLNRILIIPRFHCPKKTTNTQWPVFCKYRPIGQCYCSLYEMTNIERTPLLTTNPWREHIFLSHASVPRVVKDSVSDLLLVENEHVDKHPGLYEGSQYVLHSKNLKTGPSLHELKQFLKPFNHLSVLRFRALYGNFNI